MGFPRTEPSPPPIPSVTPAIGDRLYVGAGGAKIDAAGNDITIAQDLYDAGGGGLTKLGAGTLTLPGYLYYSGSTMVSAGKLALSTRSLGTGSITVADGAELSVAVVDAPRSIIKPANLTVGSTTGAALTVSLGNAFGNPTTAPIDVSAGTLTANGTITVNVDPSSTLNATGEVPLISYGTLAGSPTFVLGTLPPGAFGYLTNDTAASPKFIGVVITSIKLPRWEGLAGGTWDIEVTTNWIDQVTLSLMAEPFPFRAILLCSVRCPPVRGPSTKEARPLSRMRGPGPTSSTQEPTG